MRRFISICIAVLILPSARRFAVGAAENSGSTVPVVLNGVTSIFGEPSALLQITPAGQPTANIFLDVGQQACGVKLLAVNVPAASVRIENGGQIQTLKICSAPALDTAPANTATGDDGATIVHSPSENLPRGLDGQIAGNLPLTPNNLAGAVVLTGGDTANASSKSSTSAGSDKSSNASNADSSAANSSGSTGTDASKTHVYYWWMSDAQQIEQTRQATVQQVLAGELPAQPLTPLTPPGTAASLIADYSLYMEHGRGMVVSN